MSAFLEKFQDLDLTKEFAGVRLPDVAIPRGFKNNIDFFKSLIQNGYDKFSQSKQWDQTKKREYKDRIRKETEVFIKLGLVDYILIVWDVINYCNEHNIITGIGRGSVGGSLVCFLIGITGIDPLEYGLFFERFLSEARAKSTLLDGILYIDGSLMADIDIDVDYLRRHEIVEYLKKKYPNRIGKITNLSTLTGKILIKECGKVVGGKNEFEMKEIADMIPQIFGEVQDVEEIYEKDAKFKKWCDENPDVYQTALKLRYLIRNKSVHASGIVISHDEISEMCPLELSKDGELVSGFDMKDIAQFCVKLDILALKTLTIVDTVCKSVLLSPESFNLEFKNIDFKDPSIYQFLQEFDNTYGIFQLEGHTETNVVRRVKPQNIHELADTMALGRPAAMHLVKEYIENKKNESFDVVYEPFREILKRTHGLPLYQEQLMQMVHAIGFTLLEAEEVRRIVGKKDRDAVKAWEEKIYAKVKEKGIDEKVGKWLWDVLYKSKDYSFNLAHAIEYSALAAITIYLKIHYPKEFFLASLNIITQANDPDRAEKITKICRELKLYDIPLLPPSIKHSKSDFALEGKGIRYGLGSVKGVSDAALEHLQKFTPDYINKFELFESVKQAGISIGVLCALIQAGAVGDFKTSRSYLVLEAQVWNLLFDKEKFYCMAHGAEYNFHIIPMIKKMNEWVGEDGKKVARATRYNTIKNNCIKKGYSAIHKQNSQYEDFASWWYEKNLLGFNYSNSLQDIFKRSCPWLVKIESFNAMEEKTTATFVGIVQKINDATSKNKNRYTKVVFEDGTGSLTGFAFGDMRAKFLKEKKMPNEGEIATFRGRKSKDSIILDDISPQSHHIFMRLGDLKNYEEEKH
jgi:DNA polymerase-3 subunit alpha